ncbi:MAG TPA: cytochrome c oxidase subunit 4 [Actinomycetes bacterium]|nr:cytochrome c oxidase subunit 4 [Actinomycetes bacterium]
MKVEGYLFALVAVFFGIAAAAYWILSREPAGTAALVLSGGLGFIVGYYLIFTSRRIDPRPEDDLDADVADGAGDLGFFSPYSWWPLPVGASAAVLALGVVFAMWLVVLGVFMLVASAIGFVFEYYRGVHAH